MEKHQGLIEVSFFKQWIDKKGVYLFDEGRKVLDFAHAFACGVSSLEDSVVIVDKEGEKVIRFTVVKNKEAISYKIKWDEFKTQVHTVMGECDWAASNDFSLYLGDIVAYWEAYTDWMYNTHKIVIDTPFGRIGVVRSAAKQDYELPENAPIDKYPNGTIPYVNYHGNNKELVLPCSNLTLDSIHPQND